jgi:stage V sporulation protein D (sporulation-specific penicillin-binding protein)
MTDTSASRIHLIFILFCVFALILVARLFHVQIIHGADFKKEGEGQYVRTVSDRFDRGTIYFTTKDSTLFPAATLNYGYRAIMDPSKVEYPEKTCEALGDIIPALSFDACIAHTRNQNDQYELLAEELNQDTADVIHDIDDAGIGAYRYSWRFYPGESLASHVLGFVGHSGDGLSGRYGLERQYDAVLKRTSESVQVNFFAELFSNITDSILRADKEREGDIVTFIEPTVQGFVEDVLTDVHTTWKSESGGAILVDPHTGSIYAMAAFPAFDPNAYGEEEVVSVFANPLVERVYEMGSIVKPLTVAAGLDAESITAESTYDDTGSITLDGYTISNYDGRARGVVDMQEVLSRSLNLGVAHIVSEMGNDVFAEYIRAFGIDEETGIDLPGEVHGLADNLESSRDIEFATASFGQGIAMTPIEATMALSALANGGVLHAPLVVDRILYPGRPDKHMYPDDGRQVISEAASEEITRMLVRVVDEALANGTVALPHHSIAAKTGTAQIPDPENGGYYDDRYLHSFFGYFPAYDPQFLVFLYHVYPKDVDYASQTLTDPFMDIVKFLITYYDIAPDR